MTPCVACGAPNAAGNAFCLQCGHKLDTPAAPHRLATWALAVMTLSGLFVLAFLGHWLASATATAAATAEVANLAVRVPAGWQAELQEPDRIFLSSTDVNLMLLSQRQQAAVNLETAVSTLATQLQQLHPAAQACANEAAQLPGVPEPGWLFRLCGTGTGADRTIVALTAVSADGSIVHGLVVETATPSVADAMQAVAQEIGPSVRWKLGAASP